MKRSFVFIAMMGMACLVWKLALAQQNSVEKLSLPHWVREVPIPQNETLYLVLKGTYASRSEAEAVQRFIKSLMGTTPPDRVDRTDAYEGLTAGRYFVGMLFDSQERAQWWINFSYRNRKVPKGVVQKVKVRGKSALPYMPDPVRGGKKRLLSVSEALAQVKSLKDVRALSKRKKLRYKVTDYPRNGDLRYEIEILEDKGKRRDPVMVDFIMVSAVNGEITERFSAALGKSILAGE